jgi:hypothetical protein
MMMQGGGPQAVGRAASLRFLLLCLGGWILLRIAMNWSPALPLPTSPVSPSWTLPPERSVPSPWESDDMASGVAGPAAESGHGHAVPATNLASTTVGQIGGAWPSAAPSEGDGFGADRHSLRLALAARLLPGAPRAVPGGAPAWLATTPSYSAGMPGQGKPFWIQRPLAQWSLSGWLYLREGSAGAPEGIAAGGQLGGSQAGLRLAYGFGDNGRLRAYGRATMAVRQPEQRELAFGAAFAPIARLPVDIAVERRVAVGSEGRSAFAAMVTGGVSEVVLPGGFRLDAYAQAGVVGARRRNGFADGAVVVDRSLGDEGRIPLRLGALAAGALQPGAARIDIGPRLTMRLPDVGRGSRIAVDWRQRVAGDARPESGLALTLATDF